MSWLTSWIKKRSGENQKVNVKDQQGRFDAGMLETKDRYSDIYDMGKEQTEWGSDYNTNIKASFDEDAADNAAEVARLNQRTLAASGGAPAAVSTAQSADVMNQAYAGSASNYGSFFNDSRNSGLETMGGAASTMANIDNNRFNMGESARTNNAAIDSNAAKYKMGLLSGGLGVAGNLMMGNPIGAMGSAQTMFSQKGGLIGQALEGYQEGNIVGNGTNDYQANLESLPQKYQDKLSSGLYTSEGDYTHKGLMDKIGYPEDSRMDTSAWGGGPNMGLRGTATSPSGESTGVNFGWAPNDGGYMEQDQRFEKGDIERDFRSNDPEGFEVYDDEQTAKKMAKLKADNAAEEQAKYDAMSPSRKAMFDKYGMQNGGFINSIPTRLGGQIIE